MATEWLNQIIQQEEICEGGAFAEFNGFVISDPTPEDEQILIRADEIGEQNNNLNIPPLIPAGTVQDTLDAWNLSNPENTFSLISGDPLGLWEIAINTSRGVNPICYIPEFFNTKEDYEVLNGLFIGRTAHKQLNDIHSIKQMKMWDTL